MTWAGERGEHFCSFQSPGLFFLLTLPFIERAYRKLGHRPLPLLIISSSREPSQKVRRSVLAAQPRLGSQLQKQLGDVHSFFGAWLTTLSKSSSSATPHSVSDCNF